MSELDKNRKAITAYMDAQFAEYYISEKKKTNKPKNKGFHQPPSRGPL